VKSKGKKKSDHGTEHQMPHSGTKDHVGWGYETNQSRVANNNLRDTDVNIMGVVLFCLLHLFQVAKRKQKIVMFTMSFCHHFYTYQS
jgi:hypothetical protein